MRELNEAEYLSIKRLKKKGLTIKEIVEQTGIEKTLVQGVLSLSIKGFQ